MLDHVIVRDLILIRGSVLGKGMMPHGGCYDVSNELTRYLLDQDIECHIKWVLVGKHTHWVVELEGENLIVDGTASQFRTPDGQRMPHLYVGPQPAWYIEHDEAMMMTESRYGDLYSIPMYDFRMRNLSLMQSAFRMVASSSRRQVER